MFMKVASVVGAVVVLGGLGFTIPTTIQLTQLDVGLRSSLQSTSKLKNIESSIIQENKSLQTLINTATDMNKTLQITSATTAQLKTNIDQIDQLNADTLKLNQSIGGRTKAGATNLGQIASSLQSLDGAMTQLQQSLTSLDAVVRQDASNMNQMKQATHAMNSKVPGVTG